VIDNERQYAIAVPSGDNKPFGIPNLRNRGA